MGDECYTVYALSFLLFFLRPCAVVLIRAYHGGINSIPGLLRMLTSMGDADVRPPVEIAKTRVVIVGQ